jgi:hypothetical protein
MKGLKRLALALGLFALPLVGYAAVPNNIAPGDPSILSGSAINAIYDYLRGNSSGTYSGAFNGTVGATTPNTVVGTTILSSSATGSVGYTTGAGGAVTQATSRTTGVTVNTPTGAITLVSAAGSATAASFTVTNSSVAATDTIVMNQKSGTDLYEIFVTNVAAGSFKVTFFTTGGTTTEQPVFNFAVVKGAAS